MHTTMRGIFCFAILVAACAAADEGDDFVNNLFTDLAPLLALFGERATMQFISQSTCWPDIIILAMAPLGIITIMVSAIRVGGHPLLKAIIGRARENIAAAEVELMSSTSDEVCELWNGKGLVRCMGSAPTVEFICLLAGTNDDNKHHYPRVRAVKLEDAIEKQYFIKTPPGKSSSLQEPRKKRRQNWGISTFQRLRNRFDLEKGKTNTSREQAPENNSGTPKPAHRQREMIIIRNERGKSTESPNITLNTYKHEPGRRELWAVAITGIMLQLGVLLYAGFATYYSTLRYQKDGKPVAQYAYPCTVAGAFLLVGGLMLCVYVVERSTDETTYTPKDGVEAHLIWVQKTKTVNDQFFDSFAVFPESKQFQITMSRRAQKKEKKKQVKASQQEMLVREAVSCHGSILQTSQPTKNDIQDNSASSENQETSDIVLEGKTLIGVGASLCGFIVQFIGLRGMHWSAPLTQLGAMLIMTVLRTLVRRGHVQSPEYQLLTQGFELEWLATKLGEIKHEWVPMKDRRYSTIEHSNNESGGEKATKMGRMRHGLNSMTKRLSEKIVRFNGENYLKKGERAQSNRAKSSEHWEMVRGENETSPELVPRENKDMDIRSERSKAQRVLTIRRYLGWLADWREPVSTESIALKRAIETTMNALNDRLPKGKYFSWSLQTHGGKQIHFSLEKEENQWKASADEIQAALALWLYAVDKKETEGNEGAKKNYHDDSWLSVQGAPAKTSLRLLGKYSKSLHRDLGWWMPSGMMRVLKIGIADEQEKTEKKLTSLRPRWRATESTEEVHKFDFSKAQTEGNSQEESDVDYTEPGKLLAVESYVSLRQLYAQDMFSAFFWAVAKTLENPIEGDAQIQPDGDRSAKGSWQHFTLYNDQLLRIVQEIHNTGLGSLGEIYLCIIPPLSKERKLPQPNAIIEWTRQHTQRHEQIRHWKEVDNGYKWLWQIAILYPKDSNIWKKAMVTVLGYLGQIDSAIKLKREQKEESNIDELKKILESWTKEKNELKKSASRMLALYKKHDPNLQDELMEMIQDILGKEGSQNEQVTYNGTSLEGNDTSVDKPEKETLISLHDLAVGIRTFSVGDISGKIKKMEQEIENGKDLEARDSCGRTLLHCAAMRTSPMIGSRIRQRADVKHFPELSHDRRGISEILKLGADFRARDLTGRTPLHYACQLGADTTATNELLKMGADINARDLLERTPLHYAASKSSNKQNMQALLREGADINAQGRDGKAPLHCAAMNGETDSVSLLIESGAAVDITDTTEHTPALLAAFHGNFEIFEYLWTSTGTNKMMRNRYGRTAFHLATLSGKTNIVEYLGRNFGPNIDSKGRDGKTALHLACSSGNKDMVECLVNLEANCNVEDNDQNTPLLVALKDKRVDICKFLIEKGVDVDFEDECAESALSKAVKNNDESTLRLLIELGANIDFQDSFGTTALMKATEDKNEDMIRCLLKFGANKDLQDIWGRTALLMAMDNKDHHIAQLLIAKGANLDSRDHHDRTALFMAIREGNENMARLLITGGANLNNKDRFGDTALLMAITKGSEDIAQLLITGGANLDIKDRYDNTALLMAIEKGREDIARLLITYGANLDNKDRYDNTALLMAVEKGSEDIARLLITSGADRNVKDRHGRTLLEVAEWTSNAMVQIVEATPTNPS